MSAGGSIVNVGSGRSLIGMGMFTDDGESKAELHCFVDPQAVRIEGKERVPPRRWASADEIAEAILILGATTSATSAAWSADGGTTAI